MYTNLLRNSILILGILTLLCVGLMVYSQYKAATASKVDMCIQTGNNHDSEMPWEALARQLMGAVSL